MTPQVTYNCQNLSSSDDQVPANCNKLYFSELPGNLFLSKTVTQWQPKWPIFVTDWHPAHPEEPLIVTKYHLVTPKWPLIVTNCISVTHQVNP